MRPSEKYAVRRGSMENGRRMHSACFAHASQRWPRRSSSLPCPASDNSKVNEQAAPKTWERLRCVEAILDAGGLTESGLDECDGALPNHEHGCVAATGPGNARHDRRIDDGQPLDPLHVTVLVHDRHRVGIGTHLARPGDVPGSADGLPDI